ncbi:TrbG/VirB9 family P-type conjugative transfer protein (plasmid) [Paraburkholderia sprentiae WSM5005]|uniref:TrbG/VirB9 family P-type conjugative transfer protein n=1 Tax=Paraburkholderia sprentiae WSM5005 TaxID=754502 RepID=A0A1I9YW35_9BURK|nr:TrbG/VirB9 family P-type conjugative transfer protein [Paraburkholderia sprentiae]APA90440.1 TrbG/VirB9 family P-type conjugative transfer protein [Paraburkholderia sprentiae WSM5005]
MKFHVSRIALACIALLVAITAHAANTDPFDFDYEIAGGIAERPALIFNDGSKTYIQPRAGQVISAVGGHTEGPYVVVDGTPETITYSVAGRTASARWTKANAFIGGGASGALAALRDDQPAGFDGFTNRLVLIGTHGALEPVRALKASMPVASFVKALAPQGWTGSAQKDVDITDASAFATRAGENWMQALDRLMTQSGLYADVDFTSRHIRLHRDAPKSGALNYAAGEKSQPDTIAQTVVANGDAAKPDAPTASASLLAENFGAQAIRDGDDTHTQIRFASKPAHELTFKTPDGRSLHPKWNGDTNVMTVERAQRIVVSDGSKSVEVGRSAGTVYDFDQANAAHLLAVFDNDGHTYFKFADSVIQIHVADVRHLGSGEQKGRYYMFNGTSEQFIVTADGNTVNVMRRHDVKYFERLAPGAPVAPTTTATAVAKS